MESLGKAKKWRNVRQFDFKHSIRYNLLYISLKLNVYAKVIADRIDYFIRYVY